jgi:hypothetical protein
MTTTIVVLHQVGNGVNQIEVGMDDYLWDTTAMETMLLDAFQNDELGDDAHITDTFFEILKYASTTPLFGPSRVKVYPVGDNNVTVQLESKFWHVKCMFLNNIEVTHHQVPYILRNLVTQSTLKMVDFMNVK